MLNKVFRLWISALVANI